MDNFGFSAHYFALNVGLFMSGNCNAVSDKLGQEFNITTSTSTKKHSVQHHKAKTRFR